MITIYDPSTGETIRREETPEEIAEREREKEEYEARYAPRADHDIETDELFTSFGESYRAVYTISRGEKIIPGVNCEPVNLIELLNEQNKESEE